VTKEIPDYNPEEFEQPDFEDLGPDADKYFDELPDQNDETFIKIKR
jgi:hypothetical protein